MEKGEKSITLDEFIEMFHAEDGLERSSHNREFYYTMVGKALRENETMETLRKAAEAGDQEKAMESSHLLKDIYHIIGLHELYKKTNSLFERCIKAEKANSAELLTLYAPVSQEYDRVLDAYDRIKM